jgi:hypothetical protein
MAKFMIEETLASPAFSGMLQKPEDRGEVLKPIFEAAGCRLEQYYVSGIENKTYLVVEAPDLKNVFTVGATFMAEGAASSIKYIPLMTLPEAVDICKKAASLGYQPPGK